MMSNLLARYGLLVKCLISVGLLFWLISKADVAAIVAAIYDANPIWVGIALSMQFGGIFIAAVRWQSLLKAKNIVATIPRLYTSYVVSFLFQNILPSTIGGDVVRAYDSWQRGQNKADSVAVIVADRTLGTLALALLALISGSYTFGLVDTLARVPYRYVGSMGVIFSLVIAAVVLIDRSRAARLPMQLYAISARLCAISARLCAVPFMPKVVRLGEALLTFRTQPKTVMYAFALSLLLQVNVILFYYVIAQALHLTVPVFYFGLMIPVILVVMMVPISVNGIGLRESAFVFFLTAQGITREDALALAWIAYGLVLLQGVIGGIVYILRK